MSLRIIDVIQGENPTFQLTEAVAAPVWGCFSVVAMETAGVGRWS